MGATTGPGLTAARPPRPRPPLPAHAHRSSPDPAARSAHTARTPSPGPKADRAAASASHRPDGSMDPDRAGRRSGNGGAYDAATAAVLKRRIAFVLAAPDRKAAMLAKKYPPINGTAYHHAHHATGTAPTAPASASASAPAAYKDGTGRTAPLRRTLAEDWGLAMAWRSPSRSQPIVPVGPGLRNLGNTCFLNAVLQCLAHTAPLANLLLSQRHSQTCTRRATAFCLLCTFERHVVASFGKGARSGAAGGVLDPRAIAGRIRLIAKQMRPGNQEDAHEFLRYFLEHLHRDVALTPPAAGRPQGSGTHGSSDPASRDASIVRTIFGGAVRSTVTCMRCKTPSHTYDPIMDLSLDIQHADSVARALRSFTRIERLVGANQYRCAPCKALRDATKQVTLAEAPRILTLQFKRFDFAFGRGHGGGKINRHIAFETALDVGPYLSAAAAGAAVPLSKAQQKHQKKQHQQQQPHAAPASRPSSAQTPGHAPAACWYDLYGVVVHAGHSPNSGHYYAYVRAHNGTWYRMNDASVSQVGLKTVQAEAAYMLFYARREPTPPAKPVKPAAATAAATATTPTTASPAGDDRAGAAAMAALSAAQRQQLAKLTGIPTPDTSASEPESSGHEEDEDERGRVVAPTATATATAAAGLPRPATAASLPSPGVSSGSSGADSGSDSESDSGSDAVAAADTDADAAVPDAVDRTAHDWAVPDLAAALQLRAAAPAAPRIKATGAWSVIDGSAAAAAAAETGAWVCLAAPAAAATTVIDGAPARSHAAPPQPSTPAAEDGPAARARFAARAQLVDDLSAPDRVATWDADADAAAASVGAKPGGGVLSGLAQVLAARSMIKRNRLDDAEYDRGRVKKVRRGAGAAAANGGVLPRSALSDAARLAEAAQAFQRSVEAAKGFKGKGKGKFKKGADVVAEALGKKKPHAKHHRRPQPY